MSGSRYGFACPAPKAQERRFDQAVGKLWIAGQHTRISAEPGKLGQEVGCAERHRHACKCGAIDGAIYYRFLIPPNQDEDKMRYGNVQGSDLLCGPERVVALLRKSHHDRRVIAGADVREHLALGRARSDRV